ncbi:MG2 domain protein [Pirellulimonas nuda]|uniref:MG2 domain protein n=1 Tax=Pirellulimonas nuda TaxID=2528009 RepID=A0A518DF79_9BACT|nr:MG2 domain-containing protein [Pirellulimonas nuda]QDU90092.1 MG2 domain protein [Pirellulimonas nuda]
MTLLPRRAHALLLVPVLAGISLLMAASPPPDGQKAAKTLIEAGNHAEAYDTLLRTLRAPTADPAELATAVQWAIDCLQRLNRINEADALLAEVAQRYPKQPKVLAAIARETLSLPHYGFLVSGEFRRGQHRGGGRVVNAFERDRVRALGLLEQAIAADPKQTDANIWRMLSDALMGQSQGGGAWRLQLLTDLAELPDYEEGWGQARSASGAPVDEQGEPIYYNTPDGWQAAANDGERWRWALAQWANEGPYARSSATSKRIDFLRSQFGVETLQQWSAWFGRGREDQSAKSSTFALHTLGEDETIARLATGVKRFKLPDDHNPIKLLQSELAIGEQEENESLTAGAASQLAEVFENRRQYPRAAEYWRTALEHLKGDQNASPRENARQHIAQIEKPWGQFEGAAMQPAGRGAVVSYRFRNGDSVEMTAQVVKVDALLKDVKAYLESSPNQLEWQKVNVDSIGYRLVEQEETKYLGEEVARWTAELKPAELHFDRRTDLTTPLQEAGAYLVTAKLKDGNTSKIVVWVADAAIAQKNASGKSLYYVADAVSGQPIAGAQLELFGYRQVQEGQRNRFRVETDRITETTSAQGLSTVAIPTKPGGNQYQWLVTARAADGRFAFLGFNGYWLPERSQQSLNQTKAIVITDRPVYRPGQPVHGKAWVARAAYDLPDGPNEFAHKSFAVELFDPKNDRIEQKTIVSNAQGGLQFDYELPEGCTLGVYRWSITGHGQGTFRVEEYKKPEYEVTVDAPADPVRLGQPFEATIRANYYFGSPVTSATVKYKVTRTTRDQHWFPPSPWDWLYGPGYWWFGDDYAWYPGFARWGCPPPRPWWGWHRPDAPEVVAEGEAPIGADGTLKVPVETALAKELHGDSDHEYQVTAEVVDASRRTIVGTGSVVVARRAFEVFVWLDRGYFRVGDTATASVAVRRPDGKPVQGMGKLRLLRVTYPADNPAGDEPNKAIEPIETEVSAWDLATDAEGRAELKIKASEPGQYRLAYEMKDSADRRIEGAILFTIVGEGFDGSQFEFNDLELVLDKKTYAPGDKVRLQVNTARTGSSVLLFVRPEGGVYPQPQLVKLAGKSTIVEIEVAQGDMPNFFVEGLTIADAKLHTVVRSVVVPPEKRVLNVEASPSAPAYKPGQEAKIKLRVTGADGEPVTGETVVAIYDKSIDAIAGGSNVPDIREHFWKWRRDHTAQTTTNLSRYEGNLIPKGAVGMQFIGVFGYSVPEETGNLEWDTSSVSGGFGGGGRREMMMSGRAMPMSAAAPAMEMQFGMADGAPAPAMRMAKEAAGEAPAAEVQPTVRTNFADTALWVGSLEVGADGLAEVDLTMPENLTAWRIRAWTMSAGTRVGEASTEVVTRKNLLVRLQQPRFLVETDEVVLSANVHNYLDSAKQVRVKLELDGGVLSPIDGTESTIEVPAGEDRRVDWRVRATGEGEATVRVLALTDEESDAMQLKLPVVVHGMQKLEARSGVIAADGKSGTFEFTVPEKRRPAQSRLEVRFSPTLAGAMLDALPFLIDYPHGCTEQTLNRFLPAVVTQQTLQRMGIDLAAVKGGANLNPQEIGDPDKRAEGWQRYDRSPVFDQAQLDTIVKTGVRRLADMQLSDGGWGWFSGWGEHASAHTTAVVVRGLLVAKANDVAIPEEVVNRGVEWLGRHQKEQLAALANVDDKGRPKDKDKPYKLYADNADALVQLVLAQAGKPSDAMRTRLDRDRTKLSPYGVALFGLSLQAEGAKLDGANGPKDQMLATAIRNLRQFVVEDDENQTAWLNLGQSPWWFWYGSEIETQAAFLKLLSATEPDGELASRLVKYLLNNRKHASYWDSTRDTALVVEAMADYLKATGQAKPDMAIEVWIDGQKQRDVRVTADNLFSFDNTVVIEGAALEAGRHTIELRKQGAGRLYYNGYLSLFTMEDDLRAAGLEVKASRKLYKLAPVEATADVAGARGQAISHEVEKYDRTEIVNLGEVASGDLVEVELTLNSKNDYEYLIITDPKAAGFEPVDLRSGYNGNDLGAYVEFRDRTVDFFARRLARGQHSVRYRLRAETPGKFSALPTVIQAMYAPELRGNSDELRVRVVE